MYLWLHCAKLSVNVFNFPGPCTSSLTVNLTGAWRKDDKGSSLRPASGFFACDRELQYARHWFR